MKNDDGLDSEARPLQTHFPGVFEYLQSLPCIRWGKVADLRQRLSSGCWNPRTRRVAEGILSEHLFDGKSPEVFQKRAFLRVEE